MSGNDFHQRIKQRAEQYRQRETPACDVTGEIALLRAYIDEIQSDEILPLTQRMAMVRGLADSVRALAATDFKVGAQSGKYLTVEAVGRIASRICELVCAELRELPDYEERAENIIGEVASIISSEQNQPAEIRRLERQ